jgi:hypothetical protein
MNADDKGVLLEGLDDVAKLVIDARRLPLFFGHAAHQFLGIEIDHMGLLPGLAVNASGSDFFLHGGNEILKFEIVAVKPFFVGRFLGDNHDRLVSLRRI